MPHALCPMPFRLALGTLCRDEDYLLPQELV